MNLEHKSKLFSGAVLMVALGLFVKVIGLLSTLVLARLLTPADFGLVALVMAVYAFIELLNALGFDVVLIQKQDASKEHYDTAWTLKVVFSAVALVIMILVATPMATFYGDERVTVLAYCLSLMFLLNDWLIILDT